MVNDLLKRMPTQLKLVFSLFSRMTYTSINDISLYLNLLSFTLIVNDTLAGKKKPLETFKFSCEVSKAKMSSV